LDDDDVDDDDDMAMMEMPHNVSMCHSPCPVRLTGCKCHCRYVTV